MKILQVVPWFPPAYSFGGPVIISYWISKELVRRGHEVVVCTTNVKDFSSTLNVYLETINGIKVYRFKNISTMLVKKLKLFLTPHMASYLDKYLKNFDIVHLHGYRTYQNTIIHKYAKRYGIPYILQPHGSLIKVEAWKRLKQIYDWLIGYKLLQDASKVIALSQFEMKRCINMRISGEKIAIIPNGIDLSEYRNIPPKGSFKQKYDILEDKKIILYLGRLHRTKRIDLLIRAYAYLTNNMKFKDSILVIAGPDDGYFKEAKLLTNNLGISNSVVFTGFMDSKDKIKALVDADVFVTPSFYGFPITFLEACAVGTPIVTTNLGDTLEWINKVGYVTKPTISDISKAIYQILSDNKIHRKLSQNCKKLVQTDFSIEIITNKLEEIYKKCLFNGNT